MPSQFIEPDTAAPESQHLTALVPTWDSGEETCVLSRTGSFLFGSARNCNVRVALPGVAAQHCQIECHNGVVIVTPLDGNHVWLNDLLVNGSQRTTAGDTLAIGPATFRVERRRDTSFQRPVASRALTSQRPFSLQTQIPETSSSTPNRLSSAHSQLDAAFASADENRSRALDGRESQLTDLQMRLQQRSIELDVRAERLTQQQSELLTRQTQLDQRKEEIESQHREVFANISHRQDEILQGSQKELAAQKTELDELASQLDDRQRSLRDREQRLQKASESLAARDSELESLRKELEAARSRHAHEQAEAQKHLDQVQAEQTNQLESLRSRIKRRDADIARGRNTLKERSLQIAASAEELAGKAQELQSAQEQIEQLRQTHVQEIELLRGEQAELVAQHAQERSEWQQRAESLTKSADGIAAQTAKLEKTQLRFAKAKQDHLHRIEAAREELAQREKDLTRQLSAVEEQSHAIELSAKDIKSRSQKLSADRERLDAERAQQTAELQAVREEIDARKGDLDRRESEILETVTNQQEYTAQLESREQEAQKLTQRLSEQQSDLEKREAELISKAACDQNWNAQIEGREAEVAQTAEQLEVRIQQLESDSEALNQQKAAHEAACSDWQNQTTKAEDALREKESALSETEQRLLQESDNLRDRTEQMAAELRAAEATLSDAEAAGHQRSEALEAKSAELKTWEEELQQRYHETADRVHHLKRLASEAKAAPPETAPAALSVAESHQFSEELEAERRRVQTLTEERDDLSTALTELRGAFESVRDELMNRNEAPAQDDSELEEAQQKLTESNQALEQTREALSAERTQQEDLQRQLQDAFENHEKEKQTLSEQLEEAQQQTTDLSQDADAEALLLQVEELRNQLKSAVDGDTEEATSFAQQVQSYEQQIRELTSQLNEAQVTQESAEPESNDSQQFLSIITELKQTVEDQLVTIETLESATSQGDSPDAEQVDVMHRELDQRTNVLDEREAELRERQRMIDQKDLELEEKQRELLESRQQLELTRADVHVSMEPFAESTPELPFIEDIVDEATPEPVEEAEAVDSQPQVRSELAELFGLGDLGTAAPSAPVVDTETEIHAELPAVDDYSQEDSAAVSMSFSQSESMLLEATEDVVAEEEADADSGEEDFVANYMEKLLARNREAAGGSLPEELKPEASQAPKPEEKKPPGQRSFIDEYMAGDHGTPETDLTDNSVTPPTAPAPVAEAAPRKKIDLTALRSDMQSFRQLSTKSAENALATHAKRQERGGLAARTTICAVLALACIFVIIAALLEVIPFGPIVWVAVAAALVSGTDLGLKVWRVQQRVKRTSDSLSHDDEDPNVVPQEPTSEVTPVPVSVDETVLATPATDVDQQKEAAAPADVTEEVSLPALPEPVVSADTDVQLEAPEPSIPAPAPAPVLSSESSPAPAAGDSMERNQIEQLLAEITGVGNTDDNHNPVDETLNDEHRSF